MLQGRYVPLLQFKGGQGAAAAAATTAVAGVRACAAFHQYPED